MRHNSRIVAAALAFVAISTLASAHGGNDDPNVVHACVGNATKVVRIVGLAGSCISSPRLLLGETPAHWAIQGPKGDPGTNGTNGTNGTDGTSVVVTGTFTGSMGGCPNGGVTLLDGGTSTTYYLCDGKNGTDGTAAARADGPCFDRFDNTNRYFDCGNGTVTDTATGLIWLKQADCLARNHWAAANQAAAGLKDGDCSGALTDHSSPGDWRLPTKDEWSATIARAVALGCYDGGTPGTPPSLTNDAGSACYGDGTSSSFAGVASRSYWSGSTSFPGNAWSAVLDGGFVSGLIGKGNITMRVWPVRGGPR